MTKIANKYEVIDNVEKLEKASSLQKVLRHMVLSLPLKRDMIPSLDRAV